ncbi:MAG: sensor domain-containing diguanylate cyclase [Spirochaetota bacterium]
MSLKKQLSRSIIVFSTLIFIAFGILFGSFVYYNYQTSISLLMQQQNLALKYFIEGYFVKMYNYIYILSNNDAITNVLLRDANNKRTVLKIFKHFENADKDINYLYAGYKDGSLLINDYTPPKGFDPRVRPWYTIALKTAPEISNGLAYQEIKTKQWLVSISKVLYDKNNTICGVIAIDTSLEKLAEIINATNKGFASQHSFVITNDGTIIIHKNPKMLRENFFKLSKVTYSASGASYAYTFDGIMKTAYIHDIDKIGWKVITEVDRSEITNIVITRFFISTLVITSIASLFGLYLKKIFSHDIIIPILSLAKRVTYIVEAKSVDDNYSYPDNEIGVIAQNLEQLTKEKLYQKNMELTKLNDILMNLSYIDELTSLYNRRKMEEELIKEFARYTRYGREYSVILIDIDFFKKINDTYGHDAGDYVLKELALIFKHNCRKTDTIGRWGGEEFLIICPETNILQAYNLAENIRSNVEQHVFITIPKVTISAGIGGASHDMVDIYDSIKKADENLYRAKQTGRNKVVY